MSTKDYLDQTINLTKHITGASSMAYSFNDEVFVYDLGVNADIDKKYNVINKKISKSTNNIKNKSAMSEEELNEAVNVGFDSIKKAKDDGVNIIGLGEMGICNTTTSAAVLSLLTNEDPSKITGRGAGLTNDAYNKKVEVVKKSVSRVKDKNIFNIMKEVGGYDIAAMFGAYVGAAYYKIPIVIDGFISSVSALLAYRYDENVKDYLIASHESMEPGYKVAINNIGLRPLFNLDMRLGEGSGCIIAFRIIDAALYMHNGMKTFSEVNIDDSYLKSIR